MSRNLAARAGRWSASHWKTATFGWIAFVVAAVVIGGAVGTRQLGDDDGIPGESGRMEKILEQNFRTPAGEVVLDPEPHLDRRPPCIPRRDRRCHRSHHRDSGGHQRPEPARTRQLGPDLRRRSFGVRQLRHPRRSRQGGRQGRPDPRRRRRRQGGQSRALDRHVRNRELRQGAQRLGRQGSRAGGPALDPGHDRGAGRGVRRARRGGHPAAARPHGGRRDDGTARDPEPPVGRWTTTRAPSCS